ncbi:hypothetical protein [Nocardia abscessus]
MDGQTIHFFHVRSPEPEAIPLLITAIPARWRSSSI